MPRYIGYEPIGTANTSVTRLGVGVGPSITSLLLTLNGTNGATSTVDEAGSHTITFNGNAQLSTGQKKFGTASLLLDGSGDYLDVSQDSKFNLTGDFTIECWIRPSSIAGNAVILDLNRLGAGNLPAGFLFYRIGSNLTWWASSDASTDNIASNLSFGTLSVDTWYHIAVAKKGSSWAAWFNGTRGSTVTSASTPYYNVSALTKIGAYVGGEMFAGYIDDVRIINGLAIYDPASASITVPAAELGIVTSNSNIVDRKYNSGIWSLSDSYDRRVENIWPTTTRGLSTATVLIEVWGAGAGGGTVVNTSLSREGGNGGIRAAEFSLDAGTELEYFIPAGGQGGRGSAGSYAGGTGGASGAGAGGNGATAAADNNQSGGGGGGAAGVRVGTDWLITAGGGGGGAGNDNEPGYNGAGRTSGGSDAPAQTGGSGTRAGENGSGAGNRGGGGGGGGVDGGAGGGVDDANQGGRGGTAAINSTTFPGTLDTTAETAMTPKAGGAYGRNAANASDGAAGQIRITVNGSVVLNSSTPGTGTIEV
jgi:hypothetical protein